MDDEDKILNMHWAKTKKGIAYRPQHCRSPEGCTMCYVVKIHGADPVYCGNPRMLLKYKAMTEIKPEEKKMTAKPFVENGILYIPKGSHLQCAKCLHEWMTTKARKPSLKTGIRCPKCHSRNIINRDGTAIEGMMNGRKTKGHKVKVERDQPTEKGEKAEFSKTKRNVSEDRASSVDRVRERISPDRTPPAEVSPKGTIQPKDDAPPDMASDFLDREMLDEIFDPDTFLMLHELEVEALCRKLKRPRLESYEKAIRSLSKKSALILKLVFRHPDIDLAIKIVIGLYVIQQLALLGAIFTGTEVGLSKDKPKTDNEEESE